MKLDFEKRVRTSSIKKTFFTALLENGMKVLAKQRQLKNRLKKAKNGALHLVIVSDKEISALNKEYRGKAKPTDVLSFSYFEETRFPGENLVGEIVISLQTAARQAREHDKTLKQEMQFLFAHGLLHIFGYDHEKPAEKKIMFALQDSIMQSKDWRKTVEE